MLKRPSAVCTVAANAERQGGRRAARRASADPLVDSATDHAASRRHRAVLRTTLRAPVRSTLPRPRLQPIQLQRRIERAMEARAPDHDSTGRSCRTASSSTSTRHDLAEFGDMTGVARRRAGRRRAVVRAGAPLHRRRPAARRPPGRSDRRADRHPRSTPASPRRSAGSRGHGAGRASPEPSAPSTTSTPTTDTRVFTVPRPTAPRRGPARDRPGRPDARGRRRGRI